MAQRYGTDHFETVPTPEDLPATLPRLVWSLDEPVAGPGAFPQYFVCKLTRQSGVIVVNGGQGGDELFGGYYGYLPAYLRSLLQSLRRRPLPISCPPLWSAMGCGWPHSPACGKRPGPRSAAARRGRLRPDSAHALPAFFGPTLRRLDYTPTAHEAPAGERSILGEALAFDLRHYLPALLQVEDRAQHGLVARVARAAARLPAGGTGHANPAHLKLRGLETKRIRAAPWPISCRRSSPSGAIRRASPRRSGRGSATRWRPGCARRCRAPDALARDLFDPAAVTTLLDDHVAGRADFSRPLWMMLNTHLWFKQFVEGPGASPPAEDKAASEQPARHAERPAALEQDMGGETMRPELNVVFAATRLQLYEDTEFLLVSLPPHAYLPLLSGAGAPP